MAATITEIAKVAADLGTGYGSAAAVVELLDSTVPARMALLRKLMVEVEPAIADQSGLFTAYRRLAERKNAPS
ncbi:hypothetical protein ACFXPS_44155 [Nocardia sp. NPDC059091]|uniref:hypothetical protein n=1 Tax=unclassified Nocardia TaxID=2637762 RepID=UPI00369FB6A2